MQQRQQDTDSLTVVTTATLRINLDGTWEVIGFGKKRHPNQTTFRRFRNREEEPKEEEPEFKPASWYLDRANEIRHKLRGGKEGHAKHCSRCGMKHKNVTTCLSVVDKRGAVILKEHRKPEGEW